MTAVHPEWNTQGVYKLRSRFEQYVKIVPQGVEFAGKKYVFDRRIEEMPHIKLTGEVLNDV